MTTLQDHLEEIGDNLEMPEDFLELPEEEQWQIEEKLERFTVAESKEELKWECNELSKLIDIAVEVEKLEEETKLLRLKELMMEQGFSDRAKKLLVFTEHRDTLNYLVDKFTKWGFKVAQIHGQMKLGDPVTPGTRLFAEKEFKDPEGAQIMVATEAAGEGINLQFCWIMINYDIPWNPNRLEQRMGRIHRYGQTKDVLIFNMVAEGTREGDVMKRLLEKIDEIRKALGTDKVYDVISEVITGGRLDQLFREALAKQRTWNDVKDYVDKSFSPEKVKLALEEATTLGLATQHIDLASLQAESLQAREQRLMPEYVEKFFIESFQALGGRIDKRADGLLRIDRVPFDLRQTSAELHRKFGPVDKEYKILTFHKEDLKQRADADLMGPGHPLFESVIDRVLNLYGPDIRSGAAFYDPDRIKPAIIAFFKTPVYDGRGTIAGERLVALEISAEHKVSRVNPSILIDCKPSNGIPEDSQHVDVDEPSLLQWGYDCVFQPYLNEIQARRSRDLILAKKHVEVSLNSLIAESQHKLMKYKRQLAEGQDMTVAIRQEEMRKRDLEERLQKRTKEIELEKSVSLGRPELTGLALLAPLLFQVKGAEMARDEEVEAAAMAFVINHEEKMGNKPFDVSLENLGFDIRSQMPTGEVRYIEVKGRAASGAVWLTPNEWQMAQRFCENYWLYVVFNAKASPDLRQIQNPVIALPVVEEKEVTRYIVSLEMIDKVSGKTEGIP